MDQTEVETPRRNPPKQSETECVHGISQILRLDWIQILPIEDEVYSSTEIQ